MISFMNKKPVLMAIIAAYVAVTCSIAWIMIR